MTRKIFRTLTAVLDSTSIRIKLLVTFFILIMLPLGLFTYITYLRISSMVHNQTLTSASQVFNEAASILDKDFDNMLNVSDIITHDSFIYEPLTRNPEAYNPLDQIKDYNRIIDMFSYLKRSTEIDNIKIYVNDKFYYSEDNNNLSSRSKIMGSYWYKTLKNQGEGKMWCPPSYFEDETGKGNGFFSYAKIMYDVNKLNEVSAVLRVDLTEEKVKNAIDNASITKNSVVFITDGKNIVLSSAYPNNLDIGLNQFQSLKPDKWSALTMDRQKLYLNYKKLQSTCWYLVSVIPDRDITVFVNKLKNEMLLLMLFIALIAYILAYLISNSSVKRLSLLTFEMRKIVKGNLDVSVKKKGNDEIGKLMEAFNKMASMISILIKEKYKMGQEVKSAELKALQAQINPHFLYNSLDLINCIAIKHNIIDIVKMVNSLAKFYKISLSRGMDVIPVKDEINHVSLYVQIQNMRFENRIGFELMIDDEVYNYTIIKILLQPLVENSILHGIFENDRKSGTIKVSGKLKNDTIIFLVEDDGVGMSEEKVRNILSEERLNNNHGYGVKNINDRIKLHYGNGYGLTYTSAPGKGTTVELRIPAVHDEIS